MDTITTQTEVKRGRGRPKKYFTEEERLKGLKERNKIAHIKYREKLVKNRALAEEYQKLKTMVINLGVVPL